MLLFECKVYLLEQMLINGYVSFLFGFGFGFFFISASLISNRLVLITYNFTFPIDFWLDSEQNFMVAILLSSLR